MTSFKPIENIWFLTLSDREAPKIQKQACWGLNRYWQHLLSFKRNYPNLSKSDQTGQLSPSITRYRKAWQHESRVQLQPEGTESRGRWEQFLVLGWPRGPAHSWPRARANRTNPAQSATSSISRKTKKAPEHIWGVSWTQEGFQFL